MSRSVERILFVELWRLGDAVAATAGLRALRQARPDAKIAVLAHPTHGEPLFRLPDSNLHIRFDAFWTRGKLPRDKYLPWTIDYGQLGRVARAIRRFRPDHVLLFRGDPREQLFFRAIGARGIVDLRANLPILPGTRTNERPADVPRWREYVFQIQKWSQQDVYAEPVIGGVQRSAAWPPYVLLHPGASWRFKQWNTARLARLIQWLRDGGLTTKIVAGPDDRSIVDALRTESATPLEVTHPSLTELYSLIAGAQVVICHNSAALHIAEALGTPCVALTGPSDPIRWGTYRHHSRTVVRSVGLACHPCGEKRCVTPDSPCIDRIALGDVVAAFHEVRESTEQRPPHAELLAGQRQRLG
jgi:ADP-heptose:LPS heptosyltransferase